MMRTSAASFNSRTTWRGHGGSSTHVRLHLVEPLPAQRAAPLLLQRDRRRRRDDRRAQRRVRSLPNHTHTYARTMRAGARQRGGPTEYAPSTRTCPNREIEILPLRRSLSLIVDVDDDVVVGIGTDTGGAGAYSGGRSRTSASARRALASSTSRRIWWAARGCW